MSPKSHVKSSAGSRTSGATVTCSGAAPSDAESAKPASGAGETVTVYAKESVWLAVSLTTRQMGTSPGAVGVHTTVPASMEKPGGPMVQVAKWNGGTPP